MEQTSNQGNIPVLFLLKILLFSYILTGAFLALLAFLLYKVGLTENIVSIAIIAIYVLATFFAGFVVGKKLKNRKYLWGLLMGSAYFLVLAGVSMVLGEPAGHLGDSTVTTLVLCAAGGMLGGMVS
ncbi:MAG: TIGR04086 family membrane protein [Lachnospiraceae bacterium]|nr:TIGR04086 family membrane protein [Lachnospiraceae bacterium]MCI9676428.1 TIGR04086 family membrane protein [Lachnospiraceae bacterium]